MSKVIWFLLEVQKIVNKDFTTIDFHIESVGSIYITFVLLTLY